MAGDRVGRIYKGPRHAQTVRIPLEHYAHYVRQAGALKIPIADFMVYRIAVCEGLEIPGPVLMAHPGLLALLPDDQRAEALQKHSGLATKYQALFGAAASEQIELRVA